MSKNTSGILATDPRVVAWVNNYRSKVVSNPTIYTNSNNRGVLICVPLELVDYAEASGGHHGFPDAVPVGMRREVADAAKYVADVFATCESAAAFLNASAMDAPAYCADERRKYAERVARGEAPSDASISIDDLLAIRIADQRKTADAFYAAGYDYSQVQELYRIFGKDTVKHDWDTLYIHEFECRYRSVLLAD